MQSNPAAEAVCFKEGHDFQSLQKGKPFVDPTTKAVLHPVQVIICRKCGMSPEHVFRYGLEIVNKGKAKLHGSNN